MKRILSAVCLASFLSTPVVVVLAGEANTKSGEELFKKHCAVCHPGGGNIINSKKPINSKALGTRNIKLPDDILKIVRNPTPPMVKFDVNTLPDEDAKAIAEYILSTFK